MRPVHEIWLGHGWVRYPIRVPVFRPLAFTVVPMETDVYDGTVLVWIGPPAPLPLNVRINPPRQVITQVPVVDLQFPQWRSFYASKVIAPDRGCAWVYEIGDADLDGWCNVIWKVWDA